MAPSFIIRNGKRYGFHCSFETRKEAVKKANLFRTNYKWRVRIIPIKIKRTGKTHYYLYCRQAEWGKAKVKK